MIDSGYNLCYNNYVGFYGYNLYSAISGQHIWAVHHQLLQWEVTTDLHWTHSEGRTRRVHQRGG